MSRATVRDKQAQPDLLNLAMIGPRLILGQAGQLMRSLSAATAGRTQGESGCCEIPEKECPPRCVCEIEWRGRAGENLKASIRFTNTSKQTRNFQFTTVPFAGPGNPSAPLTVTPPAATLAPNQSTMLEVDFTPTAAFQEGQTYEAEVVMRGSYEQAVCIVFIPEKEAQAQCSVEQGDPPVHIRAHQWYDHFQCSEPCFPEKRMDRAAPAAGGHEH